MQSIKFISLIVICATSCLALILPAVGVVPFPRELSGAPAPASNALPISDPFLNNGGVSNPASPNASPWGGGVANQNIAGVSLPGMPVSTTGGPGYQSSPTLAGSELPIAGDMSGSPSTAGGISKYDSLGFGIWLLLVPIWFVSLVVWSITPTPKSRTK
ncbi:MAG: hypothetical protein MUC83_16245 [Pirellula sp.]|nr:hypothetical protein [Pirellula sp.]